MNLKEHIREYLEKAKLMQLATVRDGQPWVSNVWFTADEDFNIYWFSSITRRHSQEVADDNRVAGAIALPQTPDDSPRGLQFQGTSEMLANGDDIAKAISLYVGRIFTREKIREFIEHTDRPHRFYKIKPTQFVLFDVTNFPDNPRQELNL